MRDSVDSVGPLVARRRSANIPTVVPVVNGNQDNGCHNNVDARRHESTHGGAGQFG